MNSIVGSLDEEIDIVLKVIDDEDIEIKLLNPKAPCFIKDEQESYIYLILPVTFSTVA